MPHAGHGTCRVRPSKLIIMGRLDSIHEGWGQMQSPVGTDELLCLPPFLPLSLAPCPPARPGRGVFLFRTGRALLLRLRRWIRGLRRPFHRHLVQVRDELTAQFGLGPVQASVQIQGQRGAKASQDRRVDVGWPARVLALSQVLQRSEQLVAKALRIAGGCKHVQPPSSRFNAQVRQAKVVKGHGHQVVCPDVGRIVAQQGGQRRQALVQLAYPEVCLSQVTQEIVHIVALIVLQVVRQAPLQQFDCTPIALYLFLPISGFHPLISGVSFCPFSGSFFAQIASCAPAC